MAAATLDEIRVILAAQTAKFERDMKRAGKTVNKSAKQMGNAAKGASGRFKNLASSVTLVQGPLSGIGARFTAANAIFTCTNFLIGGMVLAFAGLAAGLKATISRFSRHERAMGRIQALIKSTGGAAKLTADEIDDLAISLDRATLGTRQGFLDAAAVILTFTAISGKAFERTLEGAANIAEVLGTDVRSAALQLGKALQDPAIGLSMLRRAGVNFSPVAKELITDFINMGEKAKALDLILQGVEAQIGGAARGAAAGVAGAADDLSASLSDLSVDIGRAVADFVRLSEAGKRAAKIIDDLRGETARLAFAKQLKFKDLDEGIAKLDALDRVLADFVKRINELSRKELSFFKFDFKELRELAKAQLTVNFLTERRVELVKKLNALEKQRSMIADEIPEKLRKVIKELVREQEALSKSGVELALFNALHKAGLKEGSKFETQLRSLVEAIDDETRALKEGDRLFQDQINAREQIRQEVLRQASAETALFKGLHREVDELQQLIAAQRKGNRERRIAEIVMEKQAEAQESNINLSEKEEASIRAKAEAIVALQDDLEDVTEATFDWDEAIKDLNRRALEDLQQNIIDVAAGTKSLEDAWRDLGRVILNQLNRIIVKMIFASNIGAGGGGGIFGDILGAIFGGIFGGSTTTSQGAQGPEGLLQGGGRVTAGQAIIGGERRPELFIPDAPGRVMSRAFPSMVQGEGATTIIFENNFALGVAETARAEITAAMPQIVDAASDHVMRKINLGGREARIVQRKR